MASTPEFKVYRRGEYVAAFKYAADAVFFVGEFGDTVKHGHSHVVWVEGKEAFSVSPNFHKAAAVILKRVHERSAAGYAKVYGKGV